MEEKSLFPLYWLAMKKLYTANDIETLINEGKNPADAIGSGALLTPMARDRLKAVSAGSQPEAKEAPAVVSAVRTESAYSPVVPDYQYNWKPGQDPATRQEIEAFFNSAPIVELKQRMCDIGRRMWERNYVDGNGGNITVRVGDNLVLCTPTLISKGFMKPEDICLITLDGRQLAGWRKSTSEAMTHLAIMRANPKAKSCVHAHPPHATAFAISGLVPPACVIPEAEVFLGKVGVAEYQTPGSPENAAEVASVAKDHQAVLMKNHGVICWGKDVEDAHWKMENTEAFCQTVWVGGLLGNGLQSFGPAKLKELIAIRNKLGMDDIRTQLKECELCDGVEEFRPGVCSNPPSTGQTQSPAVAEDLVRSITDKVMAALGK